MPKGVGMWPAFWMLGTDLPSVGWPQTGEIDIMESRGQEPSTVVGSLHGPGYSGGAARTKSKTLTLARLDNGFHVYAVEWTPEQIEQRLARNTLFDTVAAERDGLHVLDNSSHVERTVDNLLALIGATQPLGRWLRRGALIPLACTASSVSGAFMARKNIRI